MVTKTQLSKLGLFDAKVPRYTSYPTAPHFNPEVGADDFSNWIQAIKPGSEVSLYVHIPFCRRLCWFCACRTQGTATASPVAAYLETLKSELLILKETLPENIRLARLHWGGGTPTLLEPQMMSDLAGAIFDVAPLAETYEFSVEIDPNEVDDARVTALANAGMNRASIGVQDFDPEIQKTIGREQSFEVTRDAVEAVRAHGVHSLNADILYGLPYQDNARIAESVTKLLALDPDRVALYGYAHVPWMAKRQQLIPSEALPDAPARLDLFNTARDLFVAAGHEEIGIDHFAKPTDGLAIALKNGELRRNFQGYTDDTSEALIGVGASSISRFAQGFAQNAPATGAYTDAIRAGRFSVAKGHRFSAEDKLRSRLIEMAMCDFQIDAQEILRDFDIPREALFAMFHDANTAFDGLLEITEAGLAIPPAVRPLTRMIAREFDAYDPQGKARHSAAI